MKKRILNLLGGRRRRTLMVGVVAVAAAAFIAVPALAVHDTGAFELDGNATNSAATPGDDWDNVCHEVLATDCSTTSNTSGATAVSFTAEPSLNATIFTGGGSKDPQDLNQWAWKDGAGGLPDKDNLLHSFAARYPTNEGEVLYFGSDRFDNSGDAQQGFWFFQNKIELGSNSVGGGTGFTGVHKNGDVLVISDFSNGGTTSTITVYAWNTACTKTGQVLANGHTCGDANLEQLATSANANCGSVAANDNFCGLVNASTITMPWSFTDKSATPNSGALNGEFYEGGVNLTALGLAGECFSSVASETRSSTSTTATLKDIVLGQFATCAATMTTKASTNGTVAPGTPVTDTATVVGNNPTKNPTGTVTFSLCGPLTAAAIGCPTDGTAAGTGTLAADLAHPGTSTATSSPAVNTSANPLSPGRYCFRADWPGDLNYTTPLSHTDNTEECFTVQATSSITTAQKWLPQDTATVLVNGAPLDGSVTFSLYENGTCSGTAATTFTDTTADANGTYETNNDVYRTSSTTVSWSATFTPTDTTGVGGSTTTRCEQSALTITNDAGPFPPA